MEKVHDQEQTRLDGTIDEAQRQLDALGPAYFGDDFLKQVLEVRRKEKKDLLERLIRDAYFGRLDFKEQGKASSQILYIGKRGLELEAEHLPYIIDWRAPIASMYYAFTGGEKAMTYESLDGTISGQIHLKRNFAVEQRTLIRVVDSYVQGEDNLGVSDEFLLYRLGENKDNKLRDIVSTIQAEQDRIIRSELNRPLIIQGAAGSGKTTVALHRLAYLLYQYREHLQPEKMMIVAPNRLFLDYISNVLPELGVAHLQQTTFADWALQQLDSRIRLYEESSEMADWFRLSRADDSRQTASNLKGALAFKAKLALAVARYDKTYLDKVTDFEAWPGCELTVEQIRLWFEQEYQHLPLGQRRKRLLARIQRWLEISLKDSSMQSGIKERSKMAKQRLRTFEKQFSVVDPLHVYLRIMQEEADVWAPEWGEVLPQAVRQETIKYGRKRQVRSEDLAPLVWLNDQFEGNLASLQHVVIDEAQDFSAFQLLLFQERMAHPSFTILGDLAQGIYDFRGVQSWETFKEVFPQTEPETIYLTISYRSTMEIILFAARILPHTQTNLPPVQPVFRSGEEVEIHSDVSPAQRVSVIKRYIERSVEAGFRSIAILGRTREHCVELHEELQEAKVELGFVAEQAEAYAGGICVLPVYLSKGLEFDAVMIADADERHYHMQPADAKLLYVGCTRALHRLSLHSSQAVSRLVQDIEEIQ